jgi:hypothetical protein
MRGFPEGEVILPSSTVLSDTLGFKRFKLLLISLLLICLTLSSLQAGPKHATFRGKVVFAGPEAISVQNEKDIYLVRSFRYTAKLEKKIRENRPPQGKRVDVHYYQGTDIAFKVH